MKDQAYTLRKLANNEVKSQYSMNILNKSSNKPCSVISLISAEKKAGKSNLIVNLAAGIENINKKILIIELADSKRGILNSIINTDNIEEVENHTNYKKHKYFQNIDIITDVIFKDTEGKVNIKSFINKIKAENIYDYILIDTDYALDYLAIGMMVESDKILLVSKPKQSAITESYLLIKSLAKSSIPEKISVIINSAYNDKEAYELFSNLNKTTLRFLNIAIRYVGCTNIVNKIGYYNSIKEPIYIQDAETIYKSNIDKIIENIIT